MKPKPKYGRPHRRVKESLRPAVESGRVRCARCGELIRPGERWDLDHDDLDPSRYLGASHSSCNRATLTHARQDAQARRASSDAVPTMAARVAERDAWRSSYPAGWPPDPEPTNEVTAWCRHWVGAVFNPRCPDCRADGAACAVAVARRAARQNESSPGTWCKSSALFSTVRMLAAQAGWSCATSMSFSCWWMWRCFWLCGS
jgi:hypothetical protein